MDSALLTADLLAPGDQKSAILDPSRFAWSRIRSCEEPLFEKAYAFLWAEFGAAHELESRDVLAARFAARGNFRSEMIVAESADSIAAARDHTAIWSESEAIVHLSHLLVAPGWRRSGLAGWMRGISALAGREIAAEHGFPKAPVTLVGEMEYDDGSDPLRAVRLLAYERAGFLKIDPRAVHYFQPDFRPPAQIDADGGARPLAFQLIVRRVACETRRSISGADVRRIVRALYAMYGAQFRPQDMAHPALSLAEYPDDAASIALLPPTAP